MVSRSGGVVWPLAAWLLAPFGCEVKGAGESETSGPPLAERCAAAKTRDECDAIPSESSDDQEGSVGWCYWEEWVPVAWTGETCVQEAPLPGRCTVTGGGSEGCASGNHCAGARIGQWRQGAAGIEVSNVDACFATEEQCVVVDGAVQSGPPECLCVCVVP